jgi:hypothetical protein
MKKQDLRVSANNLRSRLLESGRFFAEESFLVAADVVGLVQASTEVTKVSIFPVKAFFSSHRIPSADGLSDAAACARVGRLVFAFFSRLFFLDSKVFSCSRV